MKKEDILAHLGDDYGKFMGAVIPPIFQSTLFVQPTDSNDVTTDEYIYSRISNPTVAVVEEKMAALEHGEQALCFATGMAAISAGIMSCLGEKAHVICIETAYGPTRAFLGDYLKKFGVMTTFLTGNSLEELEAAILPDTCLIYLESPSSYVYRLQDLREIATIAQKHQIYTMIDNTYATPLQQNPIDFGIDLVAHTASKYLGGHSDVMGGVLVGSKELLTPMIEGERALFGASMDPHQAWLVLRGMRTLQLRIEKHQENALKVAQFLENHAIVEQVFYPGLASHPDHELAKKQMSGFNGLVSLIVKGSQQQQMVFLNALQNFQYGVSWGGFESLIANATVGKELPGVPQGLFRLHVGLENLETLLSDLDQALKKAAIVTD
ncbi:trans-sulfuration enzyme family protein [Enterococcus sp. JM9B]|uniref:trans-sulfuration enzyme family protein n=1 Tax=Enterococcus sp. JM9B TaxID=1857216 RepID=UPI00192A4926|nr:aminotransferase class I/II-fold pyridoxal phosphate-dependent enzyme [Enterococcus sp. JM9B]KAF1304339.1 cystathionine beta-lyase/cystathionine gamma-synthase [Enterococcus sp. JM9B]